MSFDENLINNPSKGMPRLLEIMRALRDPEKGCPWDIEQNFKTIAPYTIEEAYEVADAIEREHWKDLKNELGDLLLQTVYHTQIAEEENLFNFNDVINQISEKMIQRHPHVFGEENRNKSASQQIKDWESIKAKERAQKNQTGVLDDVAINLPALVRSLKLQKRPARVGFDWPDIFIFGFLLCRCHSFTQIYWLLSLILQWCSFLLEVSSVDYSCYVFWCCRITGDVFSLSGDRLG